MSKRKKSTDQHTVSKDEFAKEKAVKSSVKEYLREFRKDILTNIEDISSVQMVRRIHRSARRQKLGVLGLLEKLCGLG